MIPVIIACSSVVGLYLIVILVVISQLLITNKKLKRRGHSINVIIAQKYDLLVTLGKYMKENGTKVPESVDDAIDICDYPDVKVMNTQERISVKTLLLNTLNTMFYIAEENGLRNNSKYIMLKNSLKDVDEHHRKEIALYNADATAYNYWVNSLLFRPIKKIFRLKEKEVMY